MARATLGNEAEHELDQKEQDRAGGIRAEFFYDSKHPHSVQVVCALPSETELSITKKDIVYIELSEDRSNRFTCRPSRIKKTAHDLVFGDINCAYDKDEHEYILPVPVSDMLASAQYRELYRDIGDPFESSQVVKIEVRKRRSDTTYTFKANGLLRWQSRVAQSRVAHGEDAFQGRLDQVLGSRIELLPKVDVLAGLIGRVAKILGDLTSEQENALCLFRDASAGVFIIEGCAGSGKSHLLYSLICVFALCQKATDAEWAKAEDGSEASDASYKTAPEDQAHVTEDYAISTKTLVAISCTHIFFTSELPSRAEANCEAG